MDIFWDLIKRFSFPLGIILVYISFFEKINNFIKNIFSKRKTSIFICNKIIDWYNFVDSNLTEDGINLNACLNIESDIDSLFNKNKYSKIKVKFNKIFINNFLQTRKLDKIDRTPENFKKYSNLKHPELDKLLELASLNTKNKYSLFYMPLKSYWGIVNGCFHIFYREYTDPNFNNADYTINFSSIKIPIEILKLYYKIN